MSRHGHGYGDAPPGAIDPRHRGPAGLERYPQTDSPFTPVVDRLDKCAKAMEGFAAQLVQASLPQDYPKAPNRHTPGQNLITRNYTAMLGLSETLAPGETKQLIDGVGQGFSSEMMTVSLGFSVRSQVIPLGAGDQARVFARFKWGNTNALFEAEIDWLDGVMFSLPVSNLVLEAVYPENEAGDAIIPWDLVRVSAGVATGSHSSSCMPTRTFAPVDVAAVTTGPAVQIPNFASKVFLFTPVDPYPFDLLFLGAPGGAVIDRVPAAIVSEARRSGGVQIPGYARFVSADNTSNGGASSVFSFAIGL